MNMGDAYEISKSLYQQIELMKPLVKYNQVKWGTQYKELLMQQKEHWQTLIDAEPFHEMLRKIHHLD